MLATPAAAPAVVRGRVGSRRRLSVTAHSSTEEAVGNRVGPAQAQPLAPRPGGAGKVYLETYGCQMNTNDSEVVLSVLATAGFELTTAAEDADVILLNTCAIREKAEQRVWQRLAFFRSLRRPLNSRRGAPRTASVHGPAAVGEGVIGASPLLLRGRRLAAQSSARAAAARGVRLCAHAHPSPPRLSGRAGLHGGAPQVPAAGG